MRTLLAVAAALLLNADAASADLDSVVAPPRGEIHVKANSVAAPGREIHVKTKDYTFTYNYPAAVDHTPALKAWLDKDASRERTKIAAFAREDRDYGDSPYIRQIQWLVVTDLPGWLSLSGWRRDLTGGAHSNYWPMALLWDKAQNRKVKAVDLFTSPAKLSAAIRHPFCAELNRQRNKQNGGPIPPYTYSDDACQNPAKWVVILGSSDHAHFTRIGILIQPYEVGSFAEGSYEVTLPVTPAVLAVVRPEYRAFFALEQPVSRNR